MKPNQLKMHRCDMEDFCKENCYLLGTSYTAIGGCRYGDDVEYAVHS